MDTQFGVFVDVRASELRASRPEEARACLEPVRGFERAERGACVTISMVGISGDGVGFSCSVGLVDGHWRVAECQHAFDM